MTVAVYGKQNCGRCTAAQEKLEKMGVEYSKHDLEFHTQHHEGWQDDGSVDVMAEYQFNRAVPLIKIDGEWFTYSQAMKVLKSA